MIPFKFFVVLCVCPRLDKPSHVIYCKYKRKVGHVFFFLRILINKLLGFKASRKGILNFWFIHFANEKNMVRYFKGNQNNLDFLY